MSAKERFPSFFKIIIAGYPNDRLRIPPHFIQKYLSHEIPSGVTLKGPSGSHWHVKLQERENGIFLHDGWPQFIKDHSLGDYELLIFRYEGNMSFNVQIFDKSGWERVSVCTDRNHVESSSSNGKRKRGRPRKYFSHLHLPKTHEHNPGQSDDPEKLKEKGQIQMKTGIDKSRAKDVWPKKFKENENIQRKIKKEEDLSAQEMELHDSHILRRGQPLAEECERVWKMARSFNSRFPCFESFMKAYNTERAFILRIPTSFSKAYLPQQKTRFVLKNSKGKAWEVASNYNKKYHAFSGGWRAFACDNNLNQGDVCVFELVDKNVMQVHVFPIDQTSS
ncbi:B3 domain-containing protein Os01g0723500-like isoform X2 [Malania oleifera]|uniref:B3 domain-containing protein Os01g0723500-like isoform X2 n=1 Tax=Malania oleifera TaxID=397392 RepID=UPI0025AEAD88|nr:B3 domain-containing protein Os01g0723500-like isoform X2 [Malania oleifera]